MADNKMNCTYVDLGLIDYNSAYTFQKRCVAQVKSAREKAFLIFTEHLPVFTLGRSGKLDNILLARGTIESLGIDISYTDRGGDITFHGPGQLLAYPIFDLSVRQQDIHRYLRDLEEAIIRTLAEFNIASFRIEGQTGVWTEDGKMASIGIGISRWISYHGLAINANVDLSYFKMINPCGLKGIRMTSMKEAVMAEIDLSVLKERLFRQLCNVFNIKRFTRS